MKNPTSANYFITANFLAVFFFIGLILSSCNAENKKQEQPNIVWITSEDNSVHYMELFDEHGAKTPNIKELADHGLTFTRAFSNSPVCSAARSTLISGIYGPRMASHYHRKIKKVPMPEGLEMFPAYLRQAGYYTTNNAKEDYNIYKSDSVWDESSGEAHWKNREPGQPFFHVFNIGTTHESSLHFSEEKMKNVKTRTNPDSVFIFPNHPQTELFKYTNAYYRDRIMDMDEQAGDVVDELREDGLLENTFIFYFGDHGGVLPGSKGYLMETGLHVPLVVYVPPKYEHMIDADPGSKISGFVSFVDFGATVLNLAGIKVPETMDGRAFLGKGIKMKELNDRDETYSYADRFDEKYDMVRALRKGRYKYVRNYQPFNFDGMMNNYRYLQLAYKEWQEKYEAGELNEVQSAFFRSKEPEMLFDLEADPYETKNLADDPEYSETLKEMRTNLDEWVKGLPDLSFYPEHYLTEHALDHPVQFGQEHKEQIQIYIDIANLMLDDYESVKSEIKKNLDSDDPWERYWALVVCSSFGEKANEMVPLINKIAQNDPKYINRVRAAEFLGITGVKDPEKIILDALYSTKNGAEALLIMNSIVLLEDGPFGYSFDVQADRVAEEAKDNVEVRRRLEYLAGR